MPQGCECRRDLVTVSQRHRGVLHSERSFRLETLSVTIRWPCPERAHRRGSLHLVLRDRVRFPLTPASGFPGA